MEIQLCSPSTLATLHPQLLFLNHFLSEAGLRRFSIFSLLTAISVLTSRWKCTVSCIPQPCSSLSSQLPSSLSPQQPNLLLLQPSALKSSNVKLLTSALNVPVVPQRNSILDNQTLLPSSNPPLTFPSLASPLVATRMHTFTLKFFSSSTFIEE